MLTRLEVGGRRPSATQQDIKRVLRFATPRPAHRFPFGTKRVAGTELPAPVVGEFFYAAYLLSSRLSSGNFSVFVDNREINHAFGDPYDFAGPPDGGTPQKGGNGPDFRDAEFGFSFLDLKDKLLARVVVAAFPDATREGRSAQPETIPCGAELRRNGARLAPTHKARSAAGALASATVLPPCQELACLSAQPPRSATPMSPEQRTQRRWSS